MMKSVPMDVFCFLLMLLPISEIEMRSPLIAAVATTSRRLAKRQVYRGGLSLIPQNISIPNYSTDPRGNGGEATSPFVFCPTNMRSYPVKSIVLLDALWMNQPTLNVQGQPGLGLYAAQPTESGWIFNNPPTAQCYQMNISPRMTNNLSSSSSRQIRITLYYDPNPSLPTEINPSRNPFGGYQPPLRANSDTVCGSTICRNGGICLSSRSTGYACQCDAERTWLGADCSLQNPCMSSPCQFGGQCFFFPDAKYRCQCAQGYSGSNCQTPWMAPVAPSYINNCLQGGGCLNGGTCMQTRTQAICVCREPYRGANCESSIPTAPVPSNVCGMAQSKSSVDYENGPYDQPIYSGTWPWVVSLQTAVGGFHFCSGTLVDNYHVITAASCFDQYGTDPATTQVVAGLLNLQQSISNGVQRLAVDRIFRHELYSSDIFLNNIAVIKLLTPAQLSPTVSPICLPSTGLTQDPQIGQNVQTIKWANTNSATKQLSQQLQQSTIRLLSVNGYSNGGPSCQPWLRVGYQLRNDQHICAGKANAPSNLCQCESGRPLIRDMGSQWYLFGVAINGNPLCEQSLGASVYTRVSAFMPWIQQNLQL